MSNRLKNESSPYLLQHAKNPVDWHPWHEEAFERARREDKPIFLSIGYSSCHWCHVMAHESFENAEIADILNQNFISVKVDREERPDIDSVYMQFCQAMSQSGGWPMSVFMTADQKPFFAGTYFPPRSGYGRIGFRDLLLAIATKWQSDRDDLIKSAEALLSSIKGEEPAALGDVNEALPDLAFEIFRQTYDERYGGFGFAPKFPMPHNLLFLTLYAQLNHTPAAMEMVAHTLTCMRKGGIFDQIGGGFSRYSTDETYLTPHFEKMLYDNALLIMAYAAAYKVTRETLFLDTAQKTAAYIMREMTGKEGGFYSAQDADSDGEEGKFYVFRYEEICEALGADRGARFCEYYGVSRQGNFEGKNILNLQNAGDVTDAFAEEIEILYEYRKKRGSLHLDDKILTSWNALMSCAMSMLYRVSGEREYLLCATRAYQYIEQNLVENNILYVSCREGVRSVRGFLDEYAYYAAALIFLYDATFELSYLERAMKICEEAKRQFADQEGGYYLYGEENSHLITRPKESFDGALPSGNSVMAYCLARLAQLTDSADYHCLAKRQLAYLSALAQRNPTAHSLFLTALLLYQNPSRMTVVLAKGDSVETIICRLPLHAQIDILTHETNDYKRLDGKTTYYRCENYVCFPPIV